MKYFDLGATEENLARVEQLGEENARLRAKLEVKAAPGKTHPKQKHRGSKIGTPSC